MATQNPKTDAKTEPKAKKETKPPVPAAQRVTELLKRSALQGKITAEELDTVATLAGSLKVFLKS